MNELLDKLFLNQDLEYKEFSSKLTPNINKDKFIGVRIPIIREIAKEYKNTLLAKEFISNLNHEYYEENLLHGFLISEIKDFEECIKEIERFLVCMDNWAVCDTTRPKSFKKIQNKDKLIIHVKEWLKSNRPYIIRYGIGTLMAYYLDESFDPIYLDLVSYIKSEDYYVNMMIAWYFQTALAKQWDYAIKYIENNKLEKWTHNKTIQKCIESFRITDDQKLYLRSLKR